MNIFFLNFNPEIAAQELCDVHCNKMIIESAQMLANCFHPDILAGEDCPRTKEGNVRKYSHFNHPSSKWVRASKGNMRWLLRHALAIEKERLYRGFKPHFTVTFLEWVSANFDRASVGEGNSTTPFAIAISEDAKCRERYEEFDDFPATRQYKLYYIYDKTQIAMWTKRQPPIWFVSPVKQ